MNVKVLVGLVFKVRSEREFGIAKAVTFCPGESLEQGAGVGYVTGLNFRMYWKTK